MLVSLKSLTTKQFWGSSMKPSWSRLCFIPLSEKAPKLPPSAFFFFFSRLRPLQRIFDDDFSIDFPSSDENWIKISWEVFLVLWLHWLLVKHVLFFYSNFLIIVIRDTLLCEGTVKGHGGKKIFLDVVYASSHKIQTWDGLVGRPTSLIARLRRNRNWGKQFLDLLVARFR